MLEYCLYFFLTSYTDKGKNTIVTCSQSKLGYKPPLWKCGRIWQKSCNLKIFFFYIYTYFLHIKHANSFSVAKRILIQEYAMKDIATRIYIFEVYWYVEMFAVKYTNCSLLYVWNYTLSGLRIQISKHFLAYAIYKFPLSFSRNNVMKNILRLRCNILHRAHTWSI